MLAFGEWLSNLDAGTVKMITFVGAGALVAIVGFLAHAWRCARESDNRAQVTAMMLERGMSTDEIERVLRAGVGAAESARAARDAAKAEALQKDPEAHLIQHLAELDYQGEDVEKILSAARTGGPVDTATARIVEGLADQWMQAEDMVRILNARKTAAGGPLDAAKLGEALREKGFSQKQIDVVLAKSA